MKKSLLIALLVLLAFLAGWVVPDRPDWYTRFPGSTRFPTADVGELAVRLGSPVTYDRRGEVVWWDIFQYGLSPWATLLSGTGADAKIVAANTDLGGYACLLTGGSDGAGEASLYHQFSLTTLGKAGAEFSMYFNSTFKDLQLTITRYDGTNLHWASIMITVTGGALEYLDEDNNWQSLGTFDVWVSTTPIYHNIKLVADLVNDEYVRLLLDQTTYDMEGIPMRVQASAVSPRLTAQFTLGSRAGQNDTIQVGRAIITGNEP